MLNQIFNEDCLVGMSDIQDKSADMILCDLPYGTTQNGWDSVISMNDFIEIEYKNRILVLSADNYYLHIFKNTKVSFNEAKQIWDIKHKKGLWYHYNIIIKDDGVIALTAQSPFDKVLGTSNLDMLRYEWIWDKPEASGFLNAERMPLKAHENVLIFYKKLPTYNPEKTKGAKKVSLKESKDKCKMSDTYGKHINTKDYCSDERYPRSILKFSSDKQKINIHPTQKPVPLFEYLIKTYTSENQTVLDNCMGSGKTAIACINTNRNYIGYEMDKTYYDLATKRVEEHKLAKSGNIGLFAEPKQGSLF